MVVVEGVARSLDPRLDMWAVAEPVVREWIERNLGPVGRIEDAAEGAIEVGRALADMPGLLSRGAVVAEQLDANHPRWPGARAADGRRHRARAGAAQPLERGRIVDDRPAAKVG